MAIGLGMCPGPSLWPRAHAPLHAGTRRIARYDGFFVDLFVRVSNALAVGMYEKFGYSVYRKVIGYYSGEEDAYGM